MENFMLNEILAQPEVVQKAYQANLKVISTVADVVKKRSLKSIYLVARGTSDHTGIYAKYLSEYMLGSPVCLAASSIINLYRRPMDLSGSLTMAVSQSGEGPDVIGVVRESKRQGTLSLAITNNEKSALTREADYSLFCYAGEEKSVAATKTCTTSMMAMAALIQEWSGKDGHLSQIPEAIATTIAKRELIQEKVEPFKSSNHCVVLARGFNYCAALETALKIQETCYINARGFSVADFQHGPIAMLHQGFPVIILAFKGPALMGIPSLLDHLKQIGTHTLLVTNEQSLTSKSSDFIYFPEEYPEEITPYISMVFGQIFAYHLALSRGHNPDTPRGLQKVTKTL